MDAAAALRYATGIAWTMPDPCGLRDDLAQVGVMEWLRDPDAPALGLRMRRRMIDLLRAWGGREDHDTCPHVRLRYAARHVPWDDALDDGVTLAETVPGHGDTEAQVLARIDLQAIDRLEGRDRACVLAHVHPDGQRALAARLGVHESRVVQIRRRALAGVGVNDLAGELTERRSIDHA